MPQRLQLSYSAFPSGSLKTRVWAYKLRIVVFVKSTFLILGAVPWESQVSASVAAEPWIVNPCSYCPCVKGKGKAVPGTWPQVLPENICPNLWKTSRFYTCVFYFPSRWNQHHQKSYGGKKKKSKDHCRSASGQIELSGRDALNMILWFWQSEIWTSDCAVFIMRSNQSANLRSLSSTLVWPENC